MNEKHDQSARRNVIVMVHGGGGAKQDMQPYADHIANRMDVLCLNLIGHGGRPILAGYTLDDMADDLLANILNIGLDKPFIFGYCLGGIAVLNLISRYPNIVSGAALLATNYRLDQEIISKFRYLSSREFIMRRPHLIKERQEKHGADWLSVLDNNNRMYESMQDNIPIKPELVAAISCPVMVIAPTADPIISFSESQELVDLIADSKLATLKGSGHPPEVLPYSQIADHIVNYFAAIAERNRFKD